MMHRRTNSYSYTVNSSSSSVPPPVAALLKKPQQSEAFVRSTLDRRSYKSSGSSLSANKGYKNVSITLVVPGSVKYSVEDMYRPRSPVKSSHKGAPKSSPGGAGASTDSIPELDSVLFDIKEQLAQMKKERNEISDRLNNLLWGIDDTFEELQANMAATAAAQVRVSPALRRIHSLDSTTSLTSSYSCNQLPVNDNIMETAISEADSSSLCSIDNANSPLLMHKSGSGENVSLHSQGSTGGGSLAQPPSFYPTHSPSVVRRNSSLSKKGMANRLPTIPDNAMSVINGERNEDSSSDESQASPSLQQVSPEDAAPKVLYSPRKSSKSFSPKFFSPTVYYTLPTRHSSTPSSPLHKSPPNKLDVSSGFGETSWDKSSLHSADSSSMIMQISSATGQLEKVPKPSKLFSSSYKVDRGDREQDFSPSSLPQSYRLSVSSYYIGPGFEDTDGMIMKLSEEPAPSRSNSISSVMSSQSVRSHSVSVSSGHRNSILLNSRETSV